MPFAIVFVFALAVHGCTVRKGPLGLIAEGVACVGAQRVLDGEIPYRDFWTMYAPGSFYLLAGLFGLFGSQMMVARIAAVVLLAIASLAVFGIARRLTRPSVALPMTLIAIIALHRAGQRFGTYPPTLASVMVALFAATIYFHTGRLKLLFAAGIACSLAIVFKHDVGGYVSLAILGTLLIRPVGARSETGAPPLRNELLALVGGCAAVAGPVYLALLLTAGPDMWQDMIVFPLTDFPLSRGEHYPGPIPNWSRFLSVGRSAEEMSERVRFTAPAVLFTGSVLWLVWQRRRLPAGRFAAHVLLTVCIPFFWLAAHVQINTHIYTMTVLCVLILAIFVDHSRQSRSAATRRVLLLVVPLFAFGWLARPGFEITRWLFFDYPRTAYNLPRVRGILEDPGTVETLRSVVRFVQARTSPDESVFVGCNRHDVIVVSPSLLYFILERHSPTRYHEMHPAVADTDRVQREIVAGLDESRVRYAVLWERFDDDALDRVQRGRRIALPDTGATRLDEYFRNKFEPIARYSRYHIWQRRGPGGS